MKFETRFDPGSRCWIMRNNKAFEAEISFVSLLAARDCLPSMTYRLVDFSGISLGGQWNEDELAISREELLERTFNINFGAVVDSPSIPPGQEIPSTTNKLIHDWIIHPLAWVLPAAMWNPLHDWHSFITFIGRGPTQPR